MAEQTMILASDVLNQANKGHPPITDDGLIADCDACKKPIALGSCVISQKAETSYACPICNSVLLVIGAPNPDGKPWPGRGYRLSDFVFRNAVDIRYGAVLFPKSPNALATERTNS